MYVLTGLDHLLAVVADIDAAASAYGRLFGRRPCWRGERPALGVASVRFALANTVLELLAPLPPGAPGMPDVPGAAVPGVPGPGSAGLPLPPGAEASGNPLRRELETRGEGLSGLAFRVADMEAALQTAAARGLEPGPPRSCLERDTESGAFREWMQADLSERKTRGLRISLVQPEEDAAAPVLETPPAPEAGTVQALDHVVVQSADAQATKSLYGEALGLRLALEREAPQWGGHMLFFRSGGVTVEVVAPLLPGGEAMPEPGGRGRAAASAADRPAGEGQGALHDRFYGAAWRVGDAAAAHARLAAAGFPLSELRPGRKAGTRVFTVKGNTCGVATLVIE